MCPIIGYSGDENAAPIIVKGLRRMEYRGYDSVGVATESNNRIELKKGVGKVEKVNSEVHLENLPGKIGIGHTRWATHGKVTEANAHPHSSSSGKIAIVHNGILENFEKLKDDLKKALKDPVSYVAETAAFAIRRLERMENRKGQFQLSKIL